MKGENALLSHRGHTVVTSSLPRGKQSFDQSGDTLVTSSLPRGKQSFDQSGDTLLLLPHYPGASSHLISQGTHCCYFLITQGQAVI